MSDVILQDLKDGLLTITMNRPERKNAMSPDFTFGLLHAAQRVADDQELRAVLLKGAGGTFCVGGDVRGMADPTRKAPSFEERHTNLRSRMEASRILHEMRQAEWWRRWKGLRPAPVSRCAGLRPPCRRRDRESRPPSPGRAVRRLRRHLLPDQVDRQRESARALPAVADPERQGSSCGRHDDEVRARCRCCEGCDRACDPTRQGPDHHARLHQEEHQQRREVFDRAVLRR